jgi:multiple sugar transport system substrate-binding protein
MGEILRPTRRQLLGLGVGAAAGVALAGCGSSGSSSSNGKTTLTFLNWEATKGQPLGDAIAEFEKKNPDITVDIQPTPSGDDYDTKMRTALAGSNPPDIFRINDDFVQEFTNNGALFDLSSYVKQSGLKVSDYADTVFNFGKQPDGRMTSWQLGYQAAIVFINKDLFKQAGVDLPPTTWSSDGWTWDDFLAAAHKMTKGTTQYGAMVTPSTNYEQTFAHNNGSPTGIWSADGKRFTLADPPGVQAVQWAADLTCKYKVQPSWANLIQPDAPNTLFAQGKVAMMFALSGAIPYFRQTIKDFDWDIAPPPAGKADQANEASVVCFGVPSKAKNHDAAWKLLNYLAGPEGGQIVAKGGAFSPVNKAAAKALYADASGKPQHIELLADSADHLTATSKTANTLGARNIYRPALDDVYNCKASAAQVLGKVRAQVEQALAQG